MKMSLAITDIKSLISDSGRTQTCINLEQPFLLSSLCIESIDSSVNQSRVGSTSFSTREIDKVAIHKRRYCGYSSGTRLRLPSFQSCRDIHAVHCSITGADKGRAAGDFR